MATHRAGYTLIEILVTIGIILVLTALIFPVFFQAREKGRQSTCLSNQRQIAMNILMDIKGTDDSLPAADMVWKSEDLSAKILICPSKPDLPNGYAYNVLLSGAALGSITSPSTTILTGDASSAAAGNGNIAAEPADYDHRHQGKFIVSFVDMHAKLYATP